MNLFSFSSCKGLCVLAISLAFLVSCKSGSDSKDETPVNPPAAVDFLSASPWCKVVDSEFKLGNETSALLKRYSFSNIEKGIRTVKVDYLRVLAGGQVELYNSNEATEQFKDEGKDRLNPVLLSTNNTSTVKIVDKDNLDPMYADEFKNQEVKLSKVLDDYKLAGSPTFQDALVSEDDLLLNTQGEMTVAFACDEVSESLLSEKNLKDMTHLSLMKYQSELTRDLADQKRANIQQVAEIAFPVVSLPTPFDGTKTRWCNYQLEEQTRRPPKAMTVLTIAKNLIFKQTYSQTQLEQIAANRIDRVYSRMARRSEVRAYMMNQMGVLEVSSAAKESSLGDLEILVSKDISLRDLVGVNDSVNLQGSVEQIMKLYKDANGNEFLVAYWNMQQAQGLYPLTYANVYHNCSDQRVLRRARFFEDEQPAIFESQNRVYDFIKDDVQYVKQYN